MVETLLQSAFVLLLVAAAILLFRLARRNQIGPFGTLLGSAASAVALLGGTAMHLDLVLHSPISSGLWQAVYLLTAGIFGATVLSIRIAQPRQENDGTDVPAELNLQGVPFIIVRDGLIESAGSAAEQLLGCNHGEASGKSIADLLEPEAAEQMTLLLSRPLPSSVELQSRRSNGSSVQIEFSTTSSKSGGGRLLLLRDIHARKVAERKLLQAAAGARALLNAVPDMFFRIRYDGVCTDFKGSDSNPLLLSPVRIVSQPLYSLLPTGAQQLLSQAIQEAIASGKAHTFSGPLLTDDQERLFEFRVTAAGTDELLVLARDITEQEATKLELIDRQERFHSLLQNSFEAMWCIEFRTPLRLDWSIEQQIHHVFTDGYFADANDACAKQYGFPSASKLIGCSLSLLMDESDPAAYAFVAASVRTGFLSRNAISHEQDQDGNRKQFLNNFSPEIKDGALVRLWGSQQDVSELDSLVSELETTRARFAHVFAVLAEGVVIHDATGGIIECNESACRILGRSRDQMLGTAIGDPQWHFVREDRTLLPAEEHPASQTLQNSETVTNVSMGVWKPNGELSWIRISTRPLKELRTGALEGVVVSFADITEQHKLRESLREHEDRLRTIIDVAPLKLWCTDAAGVCSYASRGWRELLGDTCQVYESDEWKQLVHTDDLQHIEVTFCEALSQQKSFEMEFRIRAVDGTYHWMLDQGVPYTDAAGRFQGFIGVTTDISTRKGVESELKQSKEFLSNVLNMMPAMVTVRNLHTSEFTFVSGSGKTFRELDTASLSKLSAAQFSERVHEDDVAHVIAIAQSVQTLSDGESREVTYRLRSSNDEWRWVTTRAMPFLRDAGGVCTHNLAVTVDVHDRIAFETELKDRREFLHQLTDLMPAMVTLRNVKTREYMYVNSAVKQMLGLTEEELNTFAGRFFTELIHPEDQPVVRQTLEQINQLREHEQPQTLSTIYRVKSRDAGWLWISSRVTPIKWDQDGSPLYVLAVMWDVHAQRQAELERERQIELVEKITTLMPAMITIRNTQAGTFEWANQHFTDFFGATIDQLNAMGDAAFDLIAPEDLAAFRSVREQSLTLHNGDFLEIDYRLKSPSGEWVWVSSRIFPYLRDAAGVVTHTVSVTWNISDRREREQQLTDHSRFVSHLNDILPAMVVIYDVPTRRFTFANRHMQERYGVGIEQLNAAGDQLFDALIHPDDHERIAAHTIQVCQLPDNQWLDLEYRTRGPVGDWLWMSTRSTPFKRNQNGEVSQILAVTADISHLKQVEEALRERQAFSDKVSDLLQTVLSIRKADTGACTFVSRSIERVLGYRAEEILTATPDELGAFIHPEDEERVWQAFVGVQKLSDGESVDLTCRLRHREGHYLWFEKRFIPFHRAEDGTVTLVMSMSWDVNALKEAERRLQSQVESLRILSAAVQQAGCLICVCSVDGTMQQWNDHFAALYSASTPAIGKPLADQLASRLTDQAAIQQLALAMHSGSDWNGQLAFRKPNGETGWLRTSLTSVRDAATVVSFILIQDDITAEIEAQRIMLETDKLTAVGLLAAGVAHEFKNYLGGIIGHASLALEELSDNATSEATKETLQHIIDMGEKANGVAMSLLTYSRGQTREMTLEAIPDIVRSTISLVEKELTHRGVEILTWFHPHLPPVRVSPARLQQVLLNLLINADHAIGSDGGVITVFAATSGRFASVKISDTGSGIDPDILGRVFDPFFSTKGVWGKDKLVGSGMGLSIARNIAREHGGDLCVDSVVGIGTTFELTIPLPETASAAESQLAQTAQIVFYTANHSLFGSYFKDACAHNADIQLVRSLPLVETLLRGTIHLMVIDAAYPAKVELLHLIVLCQRQHVPCVMIHGDQLDSYAFSVSQKDFPVFPGTPPLSEIAAELAISFAAYV